MIEMKIDIARLIYAVQEHFDDCYEYCHSTAVRVKKYGYGLYLDKPNKTPEEKHIEYFYHRQSASGDVVRVIEEVLNMDTEQINRMYSAVRAMKKWYEKTNWEYLPDSDLLEKLEYFIFG